MRRFVTILAVVAVMLFPPAFAEEAEAVRQDPLEAEIARQLADAPEVLRHFYAARESRPAWVERQRVASFAEALQTLEGDG